MFARQFGSAHRLVPLAVLLLPINTLANDTAVRNMGGTIRPMDEHPSIRLLSEHVHARVSQDSIAVDCVFFFKNDGPETTVKMGFPDLTYGGYRADSLTSFPYFRSYVNGKEVEVKVSEPEIGAVGWQCWWIKDVDFNAGETKVIRDKYAAKPGANTAGHGIFNYILSTGASWAGSVDAASIVVSLEDIKAKSLVEIKPDNFEMTGNEIRWNFVDFEPDQKAGAIIVSWHSMAWVRALLTHADAVVVAKLSYTDEERYSNGGWTEGILTVSEVLKGREDVTSYPVLAHPDTYRDGREGIWIIEQRGGGGYHIEKLIELEDRFDFEKRFSTLLISSKNE